MSAQPRERGQLLPRRLGLHQRPPFDTRLSFASGYSLGQSPAIVIQFVLSQAGKRLS
jgi:hypothetical protein